MFISVENDWAQPVPLAAITSLMPALSSLMLLPAFVKVLGTIA
ncbi:putative membrane protein [Enterobacter hormaechei]|nr:putative membrane protein [Enterobacter hormaechei]